jgi:outer membrane lipoprotein SlyB
VGSGHHREQRSLGRIDPNGLNSLGTLENLGSGLTVASIVYAGLTGGQGAAEAATAGAIADIGITGIRHEEGLNRAGGRR